ncbi:MAG: methyltransferase, partial [Williamsia herbipolensis]|nr:methyltransferase [Williamsia herbipolensis]
MLDRAASLLPDARAIAVLGDPVTELVLALPDPSAVRVHQDLRSDELELRRRAGSRTPQHRPLDDSLLRDVDLVLLRLPRSLERLRDLAGLVAAHAAADVTVVAGGRIKYMTPRMNDVLREHFDRVDVTHARQKSRVLVATGARTGASPELRTQLHPGPIGALVPSAGLTVCALGGVFAGTGIDIGTRFLLENLPRTLGGEVLVDLACGSGVLATGLALAFPDRQVIACDESAVAVDSARATARANGAEDRVQVRRDDGLSLQPDDSVDVVVLNPPFHDGGAVDQRLAAGLFREAARALRVGGELWVVWNSHLDYAPQLGRLVG